MTGGLTEMKKIAAMAEAHYVSVAPHNPLGPLATAVNVHFAATAPNFLILEYHADDAGVRAEVLVEPIQLDDGYVSIPGTARAGRGTDAGNPGEAPLPSLAPRPSHKGRTACSHSSSGGTASPASVASRTASADCGDHGCRWATGRMR